MRLDPNNHRVGTLNIGVVIITNVNGWIALFRAVHGKGLPVDKLPVLVSSNRFLKHIALTADYVGVNERLREALCDLNNDALHRHSLWFVQEGQHLTDPANQLPARYIHHLQTNEQ